MSEDAATGTAANAPTANVPADAADAADAAFPPNLVDLLGGLAEPAVPAPVPLTPQTAGWAVLAAILALALLAAVVWLVRRWRANAYRRAALAELAGAGDDPAAIATVLRRTVLAVWPRPAVASLSGEAWLAFLDRTGGGDAFATGPGRALIEAPYRAPAAAPSPDLAPLAARWIRRHRAHKGTAP